METEKADKMFEELGYEKIADCKQEDISACIYENRKKYSIYNEIKIIIFHYKTKKITLDTDYISMQELQAINEKCKELGWFDEWGRNT